MKLSGVLVAGHAVMMSVLIFWGGAAAALAYDQDVTFGDTSTGPSDPVKMLYGSNANGGFTVDRRNGVELGLRAQLRFDANNQPQNIFNSNGDGTYTFFTGTPDLTKPRPDWATTTTPVWNITFSVNTDHGDLDGTPAKKLADYTYEVGVDFDPDGTGNWLRFDPISANGLFNSLGVPDHAFGLYTQQSPGIIPTTIPDYSAALGAYNIVQNTTNLEFMNIDLTPYGLGDYSGFDPNQPGVYTVYLAALSGSVEVARTEINVIVGAPILVPNVIGETLADATTAITGAGFTPGATGYQYSATVPAGRIAAQSPASNIVVLAGTTVDLFISAGPEPVFEPEPVTFGDMSTGPSDPVQLLAGQGMTNGGFTVDRRNGVEIGLRAQLRFDANNQGRNIFNSNGDGTYTFLTGTPDLTKPRPAWASATTPVWSVVFSVNTDHTDRDGTPDAVLGDYTYEAGIDFDPAGTGNWLRFDPISANGLFNTLGVPDHAFGLYTQQSPGLTPATVPDYTTALGTYNIVQNSVNYEFLNMDLTAYGQGDYSGFDPNQPGVYTVYLAAFSGTTEVARTEIQVIVRLPLDTPDVVGMTLSAATTAITNPGLVLGSVSYQYSDTAPAGSVISQDPAAGTPIAAGMPVGLVVSAGPEPVFEPDPVTFGDMSTGPSDPVRMLYGSNANGGFTVDRRNGVELGLRAQLRFDANNHPQDIFNRTAPGVYNFPTGAPDMTKPHPDWATTTTPVWNVTFSVNTDYEDRDGTPAAVLGDYTYEVGVDFDPEGTNNWLRFDPISANGLFNTLGLPDHAFGLYTQQSPGIVPATIPDYTATLNTCNIVQNSANYEFMNLDLSGYGYGDYSGFDPNEPGVYTIYLAAFSGTTEVARTEIQVIVGNPLLVPDVVGDTLAAATTAITNLGLVLGTVAYQYSGTVPAGTIISQDPAANEPATAGMAVNVVVSAGPEPVFEPDPVTFGDMSTGPSDPVRMLYGSNTNGGFTVDQRNGVEIGLRAQLRFDANNQPRDIFNRTAPGVYNFPTGTPDLTKPRPDWATTTTPVWSIAFAVNTDYEDRDGTPAAVLGDYTYEMGIDFDPEGTDNWLRFDPISANGLFNTLGVPDHAFGLYTQQSPGVVPATPAEYDTALGAYNIIQNTGNYEFLNLNLSDYGFGDYSVFDPNEPGVYTIYLAAFSGATEVARTEIQVIVGNPLIVPDVVGDTLAAATNTITSLGLVLGTVAYQYSDTIPAGTIISQDPAANEPATIGMAVNVVVSAGPEPVFEPDPVTFGDMSTGPSDPVQLLFGEGIGNGGFTVDRRNGIELGLRAQLRFDANNQAQNIFNRTAPGVYNFPTGTPDLSKPHPDWATTTTPVWNIVFAVNTDYEDRDGTPAAVLGNYTYEVGVDFDPVGTNNWLRFDPISANGLFNTLGIPDHAFGLFTQQSPGMMPATVPDYAAALDTYNIVQNAASYEFVNLDLTDYGFGDYSGFDPNVPGVYTVYLAAYSGATELARTEIQIVVGAPVQVPNVLGLTQDEAQDALAAAGLVLGTTSQAYDPTVPAGLVAVQNPAAGSTVESGAAVDLVISLGPQPVAVPDVIGLAQAAAESAITGAGLTVGAVTTQYSDTVPAGSVISQNPVAGTEVLPGSAVDLVVSLGPQPVAVPDVVGLAQAAAESAVTGAGLAVGAVTTQYSDTVPVGSVISQNPAAGTEVLPGSAVNLVISLGPQPVAVPDVVGLAQAAAESDITGSGLAVGTVTSQYSDTVPAGSVISQSPAAGTEVLPGSAVDLVVSLGPQPVAVPDVVGLAQAAAESAITGAGLTVGNVTSQYSDTVPAGSVISQNPVAGTEVLPGSAVDLVVSLGPQPVAVPDVVGLAQAAAESAVTGAGLAVGAVTTQYSDTVPAGSVISQNPVAGTEVLPGSAVNLVVSLGPQPVAVPDVVGLAQAAAESAVTGAGLSVGAVTTQYSDTVPAGSVISQNPAAGTEVLPGSAVNLVVSLGPQPVAVPDVVGLAQAAAESAFTGAGLAVGAVTTQYSDTVPAGSVISQNPVAGTEVLPGSAVDLVVSLGPQPVAVPDVVGLAQAAAESAITGAGLDVGTIITQYSDTVPAGSVISQNPVAGTEVLPGTAVDLVISLGPQPVAVPDVVGLAQAAAESTITGAGLDVGTIITQYSDTVPAGSVISQNPAAGTEVLPGSAVNLVVSLGPQPVAVPDVIGLAQAAAESAVTGAGLTVGNVTTQYSDTVPAGSVISQNPAAGTEVLPGSAVNLVISLGPQPVAVPDVVGLTRTAAESAVTDAGLDVGTIITQYSDTVPAGSVISQNPAAGTEVLPGSAVNLVISLGPQPSNTLTVPDLTGLSRTAAEAAITAAGLIVGVVTEAYSDTVPAGFVMSQSPAAGAETQPGAAVNFVVSLGVQSGPNRVFVPETVGGHLSVAQVALRASGLQISVTEERSATVPAGIIIRQDPAAGTLVEVGSTVNLVVSTGRFGGCGCGGCNGGKSLADPENIGSILGNLFLAAFSLMVLQVMAGGKK